MEVGVINPVQQSQLRNPVFIIHKKEYTLTFIMDYCRLNQKLVRKPHSLTRIGETMQKLELFQYATALYLNMVYYTIKRFPHRQDMTTIVT